MRTNITIENIPQLQSGVTPNPRLQNFKPCNFPTHPEELRLLRRRRLLWLRSLPWSWWGWWICRSHFFNYFFSLVEIDKAYLDLCRAHDNPYIFFFHLFPFHKISIWTTNYCHLRVLPEFFAPKKEPQAQLEHLRKFTARLPDLCIGKGCKLHHVSSHFNSKVPPSICPPHRTEPPRTAPWLVTEITESRRLMEDHPRGNPKTTNKWEWSGKWFAHLYPEVSWATPTIATAALATAMAIAVPPLSVGYGG